MEGRDSNGVEKHHTTEVARPSKEQINQKKIQVSMLPSVFFYTEDGIVVIKGNGKPRLITLTAFLVGGGGAGYSNGGGSGYWSKHSSRFMLDNDVEFSVMPGKGGLYNTHNSDGKSSILKIMENTFVAEGGKNGENGEAARKKQQEISAAAGLPETGEKWQERYKNIKNEEDKKAYDEYIAKSLELHKISGGDGWSGGAAAADMMLWAAATRSKSEQLEIPTSHLFGGQGGMGGTCGEDRIKGAGGEHVCGGKGEYTTLPQFPGVTLRPGMGGETISCWGAGGGGVVIDGLDTEAGWNSRNENTFIRAGEGFGAGGGGGNGYGRRGIVVIAIEECKNENTNDEIEVIASHDNLSITSQLQTLKEKGNSLFKESKFEQAAYVYEQLLQELANESGTDAEKVSLYLAGKLNLSLCYLKLGKWCTARDLCTAVIEKKDDEVKAWFRRAEARYLMKDFDGAKVDYDMVLNLNSGSAFLKAATGKRKLCNYVIVPKDPNRLNYMKHLKRKDINLLQSAGNGDNDSVFAFLDCEHYSGRCQHDANQLLPHANTNFTAGDTALNWAAEQGHFETCMLLMKYGANPHKTDEVYESLAIHRAACGNGLKENSGTKHYEIVNVMIEMGVDVNLPDKNGDTPLKMAAGQGNTSIMKILIKYGADVNKVNKRGWTPLHSACYNGWKEAEQLLLKAGADPNIRSVKGSTAADMAMVRSFTMGQRL